MYLSLFLYCAYQHPVSALKSHYFNNGSPKNWAIKKRVAGLLYIPRIKIPRIFFHTIGKAGGFHFFLFSTDITLISSPPCILSLVNIWKKARKKNSQGLRVFLPSLSCAFSSSVDRIPWRPWVVHFYLCRAMCRFYDQLVPWSRPFFGRNPRHFSQQ